MDYSIGAIFNFYGNRMTFLRDKVAVRDFDSGAAYTYLDLRKRSNSAAIYLTRRLGLKKGDRIAICSCTRMEYFDLFFAAYKTGIILTTYNGKLMQNELVHFIENETPSVLFCDDAFEEKMSSVCAEASHKPQIIRFDKGEYGAFLNETGEPTEYLPSQDDVLMLIHTGGTTGIPKAAMLSYRAVVFNSISTFMTHNLTPEDSSYLMMPLYHTAGWNSVALPTILSGGELIIKKAFDVDDAFDIIERYKPTFILGVPTIYQSMADSPRFKDADFTCLKALRCGAAPLPPALFKIYDAKGCPLCNAYGLTECGPSNFSFPMKLMSNNILREKVGSVGQPMYYNRARIVDDDGNPVPHGVPGDLQFSGPLVFSGYWNNPEESEGVIDGNWVKTGDIAVCDEEGFYTIIGRKKNMFISGGENVFPIEIENVLFENPAVKDCCVVGVEDKHWGEVGFAIVVIEPDYPGTTVDDIAEYIKKRLSTIKRPKYYMIVDKVPRNGVGKLMLGDAHKLADKYLAELN